MPCQPMVWQAIQEKFQDDESRHQQNDRWCGFNKIEDANLALCNNFKEAIVL